MKMPFPGMDPYLEHPALWPSVHTRLMVEISYQLRPLIRPRYVASVEERVYIDEPEDQRMLRETYIEILDRYREQKVVTVIELVSPTNKAGGKGREAFEAKQQEVLGTECHLVEIDLLRRGTHVLSAPEAWVAPLRPYDYLICINRWPHRRRFELYPCPLRQRLPRIRLPLAEPDKDVPLDIQDALERVHEGGDYVLRVRYEEPCVPSLEVADQQWAEGCWQAYKTAHPDLPPDGKS